MPTGTVKWFNEDKRFGYRRTTPARTCSSTSPGLRTIGRSRRARVSFDAEQGDKGPKAVNVREL